MTVSPGDESREPVLERAMPADAVAGSTVPERTEAEVLLRDGSWAWCEVLGQRKDRHGRWCIQIRYYPSSAIGESGGWYVLDLALIRRLPGGGLSGRGAAGEHGRPGLDG